MKPATQETNKDLLFERARKVTPGGVHSPVRSFKGLHTTPLFFTRGQGAYLWDSTGKDYIDFCMSFGPLILGHRSPEVEKVAIEAIARGWSFGACEPYSLELAEYLVSRLPFIEQIRFMNSGTEAVMTALRLARGATGRSKILKFDGCYHGHADALLIKAGSGLAGTAEASSQGIPKGVADDTLILELNDQQGVEDLFKRIGNEIAAIIIEPLPANNGLLPQEKSFLHFLRQISQKYGALLIFDEVISGFRVAFGGMAEITGIQPDLLTYGKIIGGGMPVGAVAGPRKLMENLAPIGGVYQAGTLSANPLAMACGLATLTHLTDQTYNLLQEQTQNIVKLFEEFMAKNTQYHGLKVSCVGSLFWIHGGPMTLHRIREIPADIAIRFRELFQDLLNRGIYLAPNGYEVGFTSTAHNQHVCDELKQRLALN